MTNSAAPYAADATAGPPASIASAGTAAGRTALTRAWASIGALAAGGYGLAAVLTYSPDDPSFNVATDAAATNLLGAPGAVFADLAVQSLGATAPFALAALTAVGAMRFFRKRLIAPLSGGRILAGVSGAALLAGLASYAPLPGAWPLDTGFGGLIGDGVGAATKGLIAATGAPGPGFIAIAALTAGSIGALGWAFRVPREAVRKAAATAGNVLKGAAVKATDAAYALKERAATRDAEIEAAPQLEAPRARIAAPEPTLRAQPAPVVPMERHAPAQSPRQGLFSGRPAPSPEPPAATARRKGPAVQQELPFMPAKAGFQLPSLELLSAPRPRVATADGAALQAQSKRLAAVLADFGVQGEIVAARPGPVVTLFELEPAPGVKSSRVISLADDIARSMEATAARVSVIPGRNAIGIELPNMKRETVFLRSLLASNAFVGNQGALPLALGETIEGEPLAADLGKMPHLLIAGTTGSGKSVGINAMILSLLFKHTPEQCQFIMIDPKMLELSVYEGIPHLLSPVVTDPKKAVVALKWTVREMEERYRRMSKLGVRNIQGYNERVAEAIGNGERLERPVHTGFDPETGEPQYEVRALPSDPMPYIVVVIDEMADLMITAGKDIEPALQRLAQMARAAGIHLLMATQRPSVDVITGTIKANFPTRVSYAVTSKIDSRTILGEQGAEQLLGMGDLLYMAGGGRIRRLHGPFVSDAEVERVVNVLKAQGQPRYRADVLEDPDAVKDDDDVSFESDFESTGDDLFDRAVQIVQRDRKASTSYLQRRLQVGYNRAATLIERMEEEGIVSPPNGAGKREILMQSGPARESVD